MLQRQPTPAFSLNSLDFLFVPECSLPGKMLHYYIRYGVEVRCLKLVCVDSVGPCGPRSNIDLKHYVWATFEYYFANYAIVLLPSHTPGDKIVYVRRYQAEIFGESSRLCGQCVCITKNPRTYCNVGCKKHQNCASVLCCKQPLLYNLLPLKLCSACIINKNSVLITQLHVNLLKFLKMTY